MTSARPRPRGSELASQFALDPDVVFLNHGSYGACPRVVLGAQARLRDELEREPVRFLGRELTGRLDAARNAVAAFVRADPSTIAFVANATSGVNAVVRSLDFREGDEILTTNHDYVGCHSALATVAARSGARLVVVDVPFDGVTDDVIVESVVACATDRTRLALLDHVTSPTGLVFPLERLVHALEARGIDSLVDGAHAPGMVPLDLGTLRPAYYAANFHKWVCAPKGAGMLYVREDRQERMLPGTISYGTLHPRHGRSPFHERFDWVGTTDPTAWLAVPDAIAFVEALLPGGLEALRAHNHALALEGRAILADALRVPIPCADSMLGSLASLVLPPALARLAASSDAGPSPLQTRLFDEHGIEVPVFAFAGRHILRISAQAYNARAQYAYLADVLLHAI